jgi:tetratricopeptide (TPR) repeat protein
MSIKTIFPIAVLVVALGVLSAQGVLSQEVGAYLKNGDDLYDKNDYNSAIAQYNLALDAKAGDYGALWRLSRAYRDRGEIAKNKDQEKSDYLAAERYARQAIAASPNSTEGHAQLAAALGRVALFEGGRKKVELSKEVRAEAEKAVEIDPDNDGANHILGRWHYEVQNLSGVERFFANLLFGGLPEASYQKAIAYFEKAIQVKPDAVNNHYELARTLIKVENWERARQELKTVLDLPSSDPEDLSLKDRAQKLLKDIEKKS